MPTVNDYLVDKRRAMLALADQVAAGNVAPVTLRADAAIRGGSGLRHIRVREHQIISDAPPAMAGYDLGPNAPELMLAALASCLIHTLMIQSALASLRIDAASVTVTADFDMRANTPGFESVPLWPHNIRYAFDIASTDPEADVRQVVARVEPNCPLFNLLVQPQTITGTLSLTTSAD